MSKKSVKSLIIIIVTRYFLYTYTVLSNKPFSKYLDMLYIQDTIK